MLTIRFDELGLRPGDRVLDVGAGNGMVGEELRRIIREARAQGCRRQHRRQDERFRTRGGERFR